VDFYPFEDARLNSVFYTRGNTLQKAFWMVVCYCRQLGRVLSRPPCDVVFIYREAALIGPAWLESLVKRWGVPIVYDIDDPIFLPYHSPTSGWFSRLKFSRKTLTLFRKSERVISINNIMGEYAKRYNPAVSVVPNFVDPGRFYPDPARKDGQVRIGWSGSHSTMFNLHAVAEPLRRVQAKYKVPIRVVGKGELSIEGLVIDVRQWTPQTEVTDLQDCEIGIVPLADNPDHEWKFFLKVVQYLALGLPVVAQRFGSNADVIVDGINGFVVETQQEWYDRLSLLIEDRELRERMSAAARRTALEHYVPAVQMPRVAQIFDDVLQAGPSAGMK
jgi:glycosyltransferase involved in cell wall biosynthesis